MLIRIAHETSAVARSVATVDRLGFETHYYVAGGDGVRTRPHGPTIRSLFEADPRPSPALSRTGLLSYLEGSPDGESTCFAAVRKVPAGAELLAGDEGFRIRALPPPSAPRGALLDLLAAELDSALDSGRRAALALSGGLDSALLAALIRRGGRSLPTYVLDARLEGYRELNEALATARDVGIDENELIILEAEESDFAEALPEAIAAAEVPLFNLHPVSKLLLARRMKADGVEVAITGDGADQVFSGAAATNYIPIVGALFRSAGVKIRAPFAAEKVMAYARDLGIDPHKTALRNAAVGLVPERLLTARKTPRLTPPIAIDGHLRPDIVARVARELDLPPPCLDTDHERVLWTTIGLLIKAITGKP